MAALRTSVSRTGSSHLQPEHSEQRRLERAQEWHDREAPQRQAVLTFAFTNAWVKSSKFTDLEAGSTTLFKQTIVLEHEGLERED